MQNYNQQQQAVILKGIAQQLLQMNVPTFSQAKKLFKEFGVDFEGNSTYTQLYKAIGVALYINDEVKKEFKSLDSLQHLIAHQAVKPENDTEFKIRNAVLEVY